MMMKMTNCENKNNINKNKKEEENEKNVNASFSLSLVQLAVNSFHAFSSVLTLPVNPSS